MVALVLVASEKCRNGAESQLRLLQLQKKCLVTHFSSWCDVTRTIIQKEAVAKTFDPTAPRTLVEHWGGVLG